MAERVNLVSVSQNVGAGGQIADTGRRGYLRGQLPSKSGAQDKGGLQMASQRIINIQVPNAVTGVMGSLARQMETESRKSQIPRHLLKISFY